MTQPRSPKPSIKFVDEYCAIYRNIFPEVRSFENLRDLHLGMISEIKRKSLPEIACIDRVRKSAIIASFFNRITVVSRIIKEAKIRTNTTSIK
jgi:SRSO17 transposase